MLDVQSLRLFAALVDSSELDKLAFFEDEICALEGSVSCATKVVSVCRDSGWQIIFAQRFILHLPVLDRKSTHPSPFLL